MKKVGAGPLVLAMKVGPKVLSVLIKLVKSAKVAQVSLAAVSMASYAYLFTWQFAVMVMAMLFIHESGHIWAMKREGIKTKGIYFIPFVGGAAVAESSFSSRWSETFVAVMGPVWGLILSAATGAVYFMTENPLFAAAASWMAMVNLFNLLPINPLDGGRMIKSIAYSVNSRLGLVVLAIGVVASGFLVFYAGMILFVILLFVGALDLIFEYKRKADMPAMDKKKMLISSGMYVLLVAALWGLMALMKHVPGAAAAMDIFKY